MLGYDATSVESGYVIDTVGPNFSVARVDTETHGLHQPIVHFNADDPSGVTRYDIIYKKDNGAPGVDTGWTTDTVESSGTHTINLDPDEPQHVVEIKAYDRLGNFTIRRMIFPPTITITAPTMASNQPINDATVTIVSPIAGNLIDDIVISGSASADVALGPCIDKNNNTVAPYNTKVTCEIHNIHTTGMIIIEAEDMGSGAIGSGAQKFFFDTTAPTITIHAPTKIQKTTITDTTITVYDDISILPHNIVIDASSTATAHNLSCITDTHDEKRINCTIAVTGSGDVAIKATDLAGNSTIVHEGNYIIDNISPVVTITATEAITATNATSYPLTGTCTAGDGDLTITSNGQPHLAECAHDGTWQISLDLNSYPDGTVTIDAKQTDAADNSTSVSTTLLKDTEAPVATINTLLTNKTSPKLQG